MLTIGSLRVLFYQKRQPLLEIAQNIETLNFRPCNHPLFVVLFIEEFLQTHQRIKRLTADSKYLGSNMIYDISSFAGVQSLRIAHDKDQEFERMAWKLE